MWCQVKGTKRWNEWYYILAVSLFRILERTPGVAKQLLLQQWSLYGDTRHVSVQAWKGCELFWSYLFVCNQNIRYTFIFPIFLFKENSRKLLYQGLWVHILRGTYSWLDCFETQPLPNCPVQSQLSAVVPPMYMSWSCLVILLEAG